MNRLKQFREIFQFRGDIRSQSAKNACLRNTELRGHKNFFSRCPFNFKLILLVLVIEMNVYNIFCLIVPLKAKRDDQSFVPVSAYFTLCLRNTVLRGHFKIFYSR